MKEKKVNGTTVRVIKADVTDVEVDAFVFYAAENLTLGSGYGTAIALRGGPSIQEELKGLAPVRVGEAVASGAGNLKAKHIIHAVGPRFQEEGGEAKLRKTMIAALKKAEEKGIKRLAFPPMGTGFYGIPVDACAKAMFDTLRDHLMGASKIEEVVVCARDTREVGPFEKQMESM